MQFEFRNIVNHQLPKASVIVNFSNAYKIAEINRTQPLLAM